MERRYFNVAVDLVNTINFRATQRTKKNSHVTRFGTLSGRKKIKGEAHRILAAANCVLGQMTSGGRFYERFSQ